MALTVIWHKSYQSGCCKCCKNSRTLEALFYWQEIKIWEVQHYTNHGNIQNNLKTNGCRSNSCFHKDCSAHILWRIPYLKLWDVPQSMIMRNIHLEENRNFQTVNHCRQKRIHLRFSMKRKNDICVFLLQKINYVRH